ncbi:MAG: OB-fold nucleic acid binding domain-containing protein [Candidatus Micrarchaeia archaeon]
MQPQTSSSLNQYESELRKQLDDKFDEKIDSILSSYAYMIDRNAAIYIAAVENGLVKTKKRSIASFSELDGDESGISFSARVEKVYLPFESKSHKTMRILLTDDFMIQKVLVLWDERANEALVSRIERNDIIHVGNAYYKNGELHAGIYSSLSIKKSNPFMKVNAFREGRIDTVVRVLGQSQVRTYIRDGSEKKMLSVWCGDETGKIRVIAWDGAFEVVHNIKQGDILLIRNGIFRNGEIHMAQYTRIEINPENVTVCTSPDNLEVGMHTSIIGTLISVFEQDGDLYGVVRAGTRDLKLFFCISAIEGVIKKEVSPDLSLNVLGRIKLNSLLGEVLVFDGMLNENGIYECSRIILGAAVQ